MKKIFSFVLMAVMMLLSTNAWATTRYVNNAGELETEWKAAQSGDVIQLTNDIDFEKILWLGTEKMNDPAKSITLDLNGYILQNVAALKYMFFITHGTLNIITSQTGGKIIQNNASNEELFRLAGSTYKNVNAKTAESGYFTHLIIGEKVNVQAKKKNAIVIDQLSSWPLTADNAIAAGGVTLKTSLPYSTCVYGGSDGVANGVRVDVHGIIYGEKYAFKANGNLRSPSYKAVAASGFWANPEQTVAYTIVNPGDTAWTPFIRIYGTADLRVPASNSSDKKPVAVYCSGYARWLIEGTCVGSTAVYVKSGDVDIHDATIQSNYTGDYVAASATNSGVTASGSAIVVESNAAYSGDIEVSVSGDSHVTATNGYAIDESVTSAPDTKVDAITITGGTFEGGQVPNPENPSETVQGTIKITEETVENEETVVTINGGQVNGTGENNVNIGGQTLESYLSDQAEDTHITTIDDGNGGTTVVITQGEAPATGTTVIGATPETSVKWKNPGTDDDPMAETLTTDLTLNELDITQNYEQKLTINPNVTLTARRVILGSQAQIIVKAGGKLIITGEQGITANQASNIILETSSTAQALFLVNPSVEINRHPKATVQMTSKGYYSSGEDKYYWHRFGVPSYESTVTFSDIVRSEASAYMKLVADEWVEIEYANWGTEKLVPFTTYAVTAANANATYSFSCNLVGNADATLPLSGKWNYFANSYTAPIDIVQIINDYNTKYTNVSGTVYLNDAASGLWYEINNGTLFVNKDNPEFPKVINPMDAFIIQKRTNSGSNPVVNYKDEVYTPALAAPAPAPARAGHALFATAVIEIVAADGTMDKVSLLEGDQFSVDFDNSYDAVKLMNKEQSYIFAEGVDDKLGIIATDNLEGTILSMDTKEQTSFTMTISHVNDMNYAIRDMLTGTEINLVEGATYMFSVPADTNVDGRFRVVGVHKVTTSVDNIEDNVAAKGIYNLAGQYMGTDYHNLPAGVYVVDGKKIVK